MTEQSTDELLASIDSEATPSVSPETASPAPEEDPEQIQTETPHDGASGGQYVSLEEYESLSAKYEVALERIDKLEAQLERGASTPEGAFHIVKKLSNGEPEKVKYLSQHYGVSVGTIERLNPGCNVKHLVPGHKLRVK